jgi:hypothetical protein
MEPTDLLAVLARQLDRVPPSLGPSQRIITDDRQMRAASLRAILTTSAAPSQIGGSKDQTSGVLPRYYCQISWRRSSPDRCRAAALAADGSAFNLSPFDHLADAGRPRSRCRRSTISPVTCGGLIEAEDVDQMIRVSTAV